MIFTFVIRYRNHLLKSHQLFEEQTRIYQYIYSHSVSTPHIIQQKLQEQKHQELLTQAEYAREMKQISAVVDHERKLMVRGLVLLVLFFTFVS